MCAHSMGTRNSTRNDILLLTATVTPPHGAVQLSRVDPALRLKDYRTALDSYLESLRHGVISGIVFADNSDSDVSVLKELVKERGAEAQTEFISFRGLDYPPAYGRGFGEFRMIDHAVRHSRLVSQLPSDASIWKVTGRYIVRNFDSVVRSRPRNADVYCHCRNHPMKWIDLYVLCFNRRGYDSVLDGICQHLREDEIKGSAELAFRRIIDQSADGARIVKRFRTLPRLEGYRGVDNQRYETMRTKYWVRSVANVVAPWLWI